MAFSSTAPLSLGILGAARIVDSAICGQTDPWFVPTALGARDLGRARSWAAQRGIPRAYGSYEEVIADRELRAIYVALPSAYHADFTELALRAGKHVLCEKPFCLDAARAEGLVQLAQEKGLVLMEAHHWRYHPLVPPWRELLASAGPLEGVAAHFVVGIDDPTDIRKIPRLGPGVMMDFGCYLLQWSQFVFDSALGRPQGSSADQPVPADWGGMRVVSASMKEEAPGVDTVCDAVLERGGVTATIHCDMRAGTPFSAQVRAEFSSLTVVFDNPLAVEGAQLQVVPKEPGAPHRGPTTAAEQSALDTTTYREQLCAFYRAITKGVAPPTSAGDIIRTQALLDGVYRAAGVISRRQLAAQG